MKLQKSHPVAWSFLLLPRTPLPLLSLSRNKVRSKKRNSDHRQTRSSLAIFHEDSTSVRSLIWRALYAPAKLSRIAFGEAVSSVCLCWPWRTTLLKLREPLLALRILSSTTRASMNNAAKHVTRCARPVDPERTARGERTVSVCTHRRALRDKYRILQGAHITRDADIFAWFVVFARCSNVGDPRYALFLLLFTAALIGCDRNVFACFRSRRPLSLFSKEELGFGSFQRLGSATSLRGAGFLEKFLKIAKQRFFG